MALGRIIASAHAEVPCDADILEVHEVIDRVEKEISDKLNILICIHMDPIAVNDENINRYKAIISEVINEYDDSFKFHDFRVVEGKKRVNVIFDLVIPHEYKKSKEEIIKDLRVKVKEKKKEINLVVTVEHSYV